FRPLSDRPSQAISCPPDSRRGALTGSRTSAHRHRKPSPRRSVSRAAANGPAIVRASSRGVAGSIGAFVLFAWLLKRWSVTRTSFIAVVIPVVALVLGALVRHESLRASSLIGVILVFAGLALGIAADRLKR